MYSIPYLCNVITFDFRKLSAQEAYILEAGILLHICNELKTIFREKYRNYFQLINVTHEMEDVMLDENYIRLILQDILFTEEYNLSGIAYYTQTPEDVVYDIACGNNIRPSAVFLQKIIELHKLVRHELYETIFRKIISTQLAEAS